MSLSQPPARSCDTFVYVAGDGGPSNTIFGKNSDRPSEENHEVIYFPSTKHKPESNVRCTYISIPQVEETLAVILSRPSWMWGCEMGANEFGVVGGNEAVTSLLSDEVGTESRLLGMDLLRLALERGRTAKEAARITCNLLETHGQGGNCIDSQDEFWSYENGFLFADAHEAYVVETAGINHWAIERIAPGRKRNISNGLSIRTVDSCDSRIQEICRKKGWWKKDDDDFDWKRCVESGGAAHGELGVFGREKAGWEHLLDAEGRLKHGDLSADDVEGWITWMTDILRDESSGICFRDIHGFCSTGSQVSVLPKDNTLLKPSHLFTASSDPLVSCYKYFSFDQAASDYGETSYNDYQSLKLWNRWRKLTLQGGVENVFPATKAKKIRKTMKEIEAVAIRQASTNNGDRKYPIESFKKAIICELNSIDEEKSM